MLIVCLFFCLKLTAISFSAHDADLHKCVFPILSVAVHQTNHVFYNKALVIPAAYHSAKSHAGGIDEVIHILPFPSGPIGAESFTQVVDGSDLDDRSNQGLRIISRGTAILLLLVYIAFLIFQACIA